MIITLWAVFSLHQAAESSMIGIIKAILGYRLSVHNLARMIRITLLFTDEIKNVLQLDTSEGVQQFNLLQAAYSDARYKDEFVPDKELVIKLKGRVEQLLMIIEEIWRQFNREKGILICNNRSNR